MNWEKIESEMRLEEIKQVSYKQPVFIFKHSIRCSISSSALNRIERNWKEGDSDKISPYFIDLLSYRQISNQIAKEFGIEHQSPQVLVIENGKCIYTSSHSGINYKDLIASVNKG